MTLLHTGAIMAVDRCFFARRALKTVLHVHVLLALGCVVCHATEAPVSTKDSDSNRHDQAGRKKRQSEEVDADVIDDSGFFFTEAAILSTNSPPDDDRFWPTVGNGHVATVVHSDTVFMNGLYNGHETDSRRARIPAVTAVNITNISPPYTGRRYSLDMNSGTYIERYDGQGWWAELRIYAHRTLTRLLVTELQIHSDGKSRQPITVTLDVNRGPPSDALHLQDGTSDVPAAKLMYGTIITPELPTSRRVPVNVYYSDVPSEVSLSQGSLATESYVYLASVSPFRDEAKKYFESGLRKFKQGTLEGEHRAAWSAVWQRGRLDIEGNTSLAAATYSALYYILSAMPTQEETTWEFIGLSPEDLAHGNKDEEYGGHVFWDQATWMYPTILSLHADLGKTIVKTRIRTLDAAYKYAKFRGYKGAMYPWESAFTGLNVSPGGRWAKYEHHITGDIALAFKQYLIMTRDSDFVQHGRLGEAIYKIAEFWQSRVVFNQSRGLYEILDVMPPDEWHWPVNNSVYTNQVARISLRLPTLAKQLGGITPPRTFADIANKMYIPFDADDQFHPEFSGFGKNDTVKQADVVMLKYPLMMEMSEEVRKNDLVLYEKLTPGGPAMTWGMFAIGWLELGRPDKAKELFFQQLQNKRRPFNVWTELASGGGATNFITGMGGFLQSLLFGYGGLRMYETYLDLNPAPIPSATAFNVTGLDYLRNSLHIRCTPATTAITLTEAGNETLFVFTYSTREVHQLSQSVPLTMARQKFAIIARPELSAFLDVHSGTSVVAAATTVVMVTSLLTVGLASSSGM